MNMNISVGTFYIIRQQSPSANNLFPVEKYCPNQCDNHWKKDDILLYCESTCINLNTLYRFNLIQLPFAIRNKFISLHATYDFVQSSFDLFFAYCRLATNITSYLLRNYDDVYVLCSLLYNDFCLLIPQSLSEDYKEIINEVNIFLEQSFDIEDVCPNSYVESNLNDNRSKRKLCITSDRQYIKHNPFYNGYSDLLNQLDNIQTDSYDRKQDISLFSSLILKDLAEESMLYWLMPSGDLRFEKAEMLYTLKEQKNLYFELFNIFCTQIADGNKYNDWCWVLIFLTNTLLATINNRTINNTLPQKKQQEHENFFGFTPIIFDLKKQNNEIKSLFSHHISRKFCNAFLIIPKSAVYQIIKNLPAYIHEFFHYIPPNNRPERNKAILELFLHAILIKLRYQLNSLSYTAFFNLIENETYSSINNLGFTDNDFFSSDSMEFIDHLKILFNYYSFENIYKNALLKTTDAFDLQIILANKEACVNKFNGCAYDYFNILVLFFREIRSDIEMCKFLDIDLKQYIKFMAEEPEFCILPKEQVGDSTIMRFGYMCHYLYFIQQKKLAESDGQHLDIYNGFRIADWFENVTKTVKELQQDIKNLDFKQKYENLQGYLQEYMDLAIEQDNIGDSYADRSILESIVCGIFDPDKYPSKDFKQYKFTRLLKDLFNKYMSFDKEEAEEKKLQLICGIKILFRDLYAFDPDLDLQT